MIAKTSKNRFDVCALQKEKLQILVQKLLNYSGLLLVIISQRNIKAWLFLFQLQLNSDGESLNS